MDEWAFTNTLIKVVNTPGIDIWEFIFPFGGFGAVDASDPLVHTEWSLEFWNNGNLLYSDSGIAYGPHSYVANGYGAGTYKLELDHVFTNKPRTHKELLLMVNDSGAMLARAEVAGLHNRAGDCSFFIIETDVITSPWVNSESYWFSATDFNDVGGTATVLQSGNGPIKYALETGTIILGQALALEDSEWPDLADPFVVAYGSYQTECALITYE